MRSSRMLRGQRSAILFLQSQREVGVGLLEKLLKLDRPAAEKFYGNLSRSIQSGPDGAGFRRGRMDRRRHFSRQGKNHRQTAGRLRLELCREGKNTVRSVRSLLINSP